MIYKLQKALINKEKNSVAKNDAPLKNRARTAKLGMQIPFS